MSSLSPETDRAINNVCDQLKRNHFVFTKSVFETLAESGALIFGGAVRDYILHENHSKAFVEATSTLLNTTSSSSARFRDLYNDTTFMPEAVGRVVVPNDIDALATMQMIETFKTKIRPYSVVDVVVSSEETEAKVNYFRIRPEVKKHLTFKQLIVRSRMRCDPLVEALLKLQYPSLEHVFKPFKLDIVVVKEPPLTTPSPSEEESESSVSTSSSSAVAAAAAKKLFNRIVPNFPDPDNVDFECNSLVYHKKFGFRTVLGSSFPQNQIIQSYRNVQTFIKIVNDISNLKAVVNNVSSATPHRITKMIDKQDARWKVDYSDVSFSKNIVIHKLNPFCSCVFVKGKGKKCLLLNTAHHHRQHSFSSSSLSATSGAAAHPPPPYRHPSPPTAAYIRLQNSLQSPTYRRLTTATNTTTTESATTNATPSTDPSTVFSKSDLGVCVICQEGFDGRFRSDCIQTSYCKSEVYKLKCCNTFYHSSCFLKAYSLSLTPFSPRSCFTCKRILSLQECNSIEKVYKFRKNLSEAHFYMNHKNYERVSSSIEKAACGCLLEQVINTEETQRRTAQIIADDHLIARNLASELNASSTGEAAGTSNEDAEDFGEEADAIDDADGGGDYDSAEVASVRIELFSSTASNLDDALSFINANVGGSSTSTAGTTPLDGISNTPSDEDIASLAMVVANAIASAIANGTSAPTQ